MADSPCMKNRSLKAGGRLNRWSLKAGFTVQDTRPIGTRTEVRRSAWQGPISSLPQLSLFLFLCFEVRGIFLEYKRAVLGENELHTLGRLLVTLIMTSWRSGKEASSRSAVR